MTSGNFTYLPVNSITIDRENRQRRELTGIEDLAESIRRNGLINPIVVTADHILVAGERRLTAHKYLQFDQIAVQFMEDMDPQQLQIIELEENIRREDLSWQDRVRAIARYHEVQSEVHEEWTSTNTAEELNFTLPFVQKYLLVKKAMDEEVPEVLEAPKLSVAFNFAKRRKERMKSSAMRELKQTIAPKTVTEETQVDAPAPPPDRFAEIKCLSFLEWCQEQRKDRFNFIHCDFPYGANAGDAGSQSARKSFGGYDDKEEVYWELLHTFLEKQDNFISLTAHMMFWFSMEYYAQTVDLITAAGWRVDKFPLIWHKSDNTGILPDKDRGPRRTYETALFCTRGDRKIVRAKANSTSAVVTKNFHMSEKPLLVLEHFLQMLVDETSIVLDPTCGSGNAIKTAEALGAAYSLGLEINPKYAEAAKENLGLE